MKTYVGIDPGTQGGIAIVSANSAYAYAMPETERDTLSIFEEISNFDTVFALIEDVHSMPGNSPRSMFTFGRNYGMLRAMLIANYIPFETVTPTTWQKEFSLVNRKLGKTAKKNTHKARAQELFPSIEKITHKTADALLIAEYCKRTNK
jgi:crossover junction endodeoxyribonuclease RuvC